MPEGLFVETTIHIYRVTGDPQRQKRIRDCLHQAERTETSSYVAMEFKRRCLRDLNYLYGLVRDLQDLHKVRDKLEKLRDSQQKRKAEICLDVLWNYVFENSAPNPRKFELYLQNLIEGSWMAFLESVDQITNATGCKQVDLHAERLPKEGEAYDVSVPYSVCSSGTCSIRFFLGRNGDAYQAILATLEQVEEKDEQLTRMQEALAQVLQEPQCIFNHVICWRCGDATIATECPADLALWSTDGHFEVLCPALGKQVSKDPLHELLA